ncbi:MAG: hypothetical protein HY000_16510 [Planctomycetes bacterium]|nr:hypothetical protein [Planctomycetota bacterium]
MARRRRERKHIVASNRPEEAAGTADGKLGFSARARFRASLVLLTLWTAGLLAMVIFTAEPPPRMAPSKPAAIDAGTAPR